MAAEIVVDLHGLVRRHDEIVALDAADDAEPLKAHADRAQMLDAGARDAQRRARHRGKPDQRADLDMIGLDRGSRAPPSVAGPCTIMVLVPMPSILAPSATRKWARSCTCGSEAALRK